MKARISTTLLLPLVLCTCEDPVESDRVRRPAETCVTTPRTFVAVREGVVFYDVQFSNECTEPVRMRVSASLLLLPGETLHEREQEETVLGPLQRGYLCGNGEAHTGCTFQMPIGESSPAHEVRRNVGTCYLDQDCPWPSWPDA